MIGGSSSPGTGIQWPAMVPSGDRSRNPIIGDRSADVFVAAIAIDYAIGGLVHCSTAPSPII